MPIEGRRDDDDAKRKALEKRQAGGLGKPGVAGRPKKFESSDLWEQKAEEEMPELIRQSFEAIKRGITSPNTKLASETALKLMKMTWPQDTKVTIEGGNTTETNNYLVIAQDNISDKDKALLAKLNDVLKEGAAADEAADVIEGEAVEITEDDK